MGMVRIFFTWCIFTFFTYNLCDGISADDDTVVVEAANSQRASRQVFFQNPLVPEYQPGIYAAIQSPPFSALPCITNKGKIGQCMSLTQCFPYYKETGSTNWSSLVFGTPDPCNYYTAQGRQLVGICCTNPQKPPFDEGASGTNRDSLRKPAVSNWPPPLPTHSPDNTIPPLPTHPVSPGFPTASKPTWTQVWPPTTGKPSWPPSTSKPSWTTNKPGWPPTTAKPKPTKPPTQAPVDAGDYSCGTKNGYQDQERIVGGHNADLGEWPWIAALFHGGRQFCGGSLINNINILTAAHCVAHMSSWDVAALTVRLGDHNIRTNTEVKHVEKKVKRVVRHRGFDPRTLYNDIAVLTLDSPLQFNKQIRPICLPSGRSNYAGQTATVIGWGSLRESGPQPSVLQEVNIPIWSNTECRQKYGPAAPGGIVEHMLCAGQANRDSCSGDSGGPLMVNSGKWVQAGIVSWGIGCGKGQYPGVYTRVEHFLPWINKNIK